MHGVRDLDRRAVQKRCRDLQGLRPGNPDVPKRGPLHRVREANHNDDPHSYYHNRHHGDVRAVHVPGAVPVRRAALPGAAQIGRLRRAEAVLRPRQQRDVPRQHIRLPYPHDNLDHNDNDVGGHAVHWLLV